MKVTRLQISNILRIIAIDVTPEGHLVTIGGRNGQGKSSAMNSLAMALGGAALCPPEPIHGDEAEGIVRVDFDTDLVVTRKFNRDRIGCDCEQGKDNQDITMHASDCAIHKKMWSETRSTLSVTNKAGASYPSPQALLNKLYGSLAFDPLAFRDAKDQAAILRAIVKLDVSGFEKARADAAAQRAMLKKTLAIKEAQLLALPRHDDAPKEETPLDVVSDKMLEAERYRKLAEDAERAVERTSHQIGVYALELKSLALEIKRIEEQLAVAQEKYTTLNKGKENAEKELDALQITAQSARAVVPDVEVIRAELMTTEAANAKVRANQKHEHVRLETVKLQQDIDEQQHAIDKADGGKAAALRAVKFPVEGLGLTDDGVTFNDLPFSQASSAEQLRVSAAIGFALNPTLKLLLIKNGNLMDEDSVAALAKQAEEADAQILLEWVTKDASEVQVFIEDGHVA